MWFLGAGASASSGIPTAGDMIWNFKRTIYCAEQKVPIRACEDLSNPLLQRRIQEYIDSTGRFPKPNSETEYAELFLNACPDEADRRRFIDRMVSKATTSFGHLALAVLAALEKTRIIWTTNFDRNIEDAAAKIFQTTAKLTVATLDSPKLATETLIEDRWPVLVKLHGDFQSRKLKNTSDELIKQDEEMRLSLTEASKRFGLIVLGYSGRDDSIMDALESALHNGKGFPGGLFWVCRPGSPPYQRAVKLIEKAQSVGVFAHLIESPGFDEFMADVLLMEQEISPKLAQHLDSALPRVSDAEPPPREGDWPVVRLNALPIISYPTLCRRLACKIGGQKEVREAVRTSGTDILAVRRRSGVLAFGSDSDVRSTFSNYQITEWDLHPIESDRLYFDSMESSLINEAFVKALATNRSLVSCRRGNINVLAINYRDTTNRHYDPLRQVCGSLTGKIPKAGIAWAEAITIRLELRQQALWLLFEPTTWVESLPGRRVSDNEKEFHRQRSASRYNKNWNQLLAAWSALITGNNQTARIAAFNTGAGVDAVFEISGNTAFSRHRSRK